MLGKMVEGGTTVLLTTQYLDEADRLAHQIVVIDAGRVIASGSPAALKAATGGDRIAVVVRDASRLPDAMVALRAIAVGVEPRMEAEVRRVTIPVVDGASTLAGVVRALDAAGILVDDLALRRATLDDVFLRLTGHATGESATAKAATKKEVA